LKLRCTYRILGAFPVLCPGEHRGIEEIKEKAMRKVLLLALVSMFFTAAACSKSEETAPAAPDAAASTAASDAASPAAAASPADASSPAAPAAAASPAAP
jgi:hypothetical protein